jgi:hypothetical protein
VESLGIGAQVDLGVEPGSGDAGFAGEAVEGDGCAGGVLRRSAVIARRRVCSVRRWAAARSWWMLSAGIAGVFLVGFDLADHAVEVGQDGGVHLDQAGLAGLLGVLDQGQGASAMFAQLGQELRSGEEHRAGQAGVGVGQLFCTGSPQ